MKGKRILFSMMVLGTMSLGIACTQAGSTPTVTGDIDALEPGSSSPKAAGFTTFVAPQQINGSQQNGIWVSGSGKVAVTPNLALLSLGVETSATTVLQARNDAAEVMTQIMDVLTTTGIADEDIRTQFFNIGPEYNWNEKERKQEITGYQVTNTVSVKIRDLQGIGILIDHVANAGGDLVRINNISFTVERPDHYTAMAREAAVEDAMAKAQQFADLTGVTRGSLMYIAESNGSGPMFRNYAVAEASVLTSGALPPTPFSPGDLDITVTVQAVFGIG